MRELKFRAWVNRYKKYMPVWSITWDSSDNPMLVVVGDTFGKSLTLNASEVILEQCTGLKDKNGREIYEGDIVKWSYEIQIGVKQHTNIAIEWDTGEVSFYPYCIDSGFSLPQSEDGYEVIGNINDNPELLEAE